MTKGLYRGVGPTTQRAMLLTATQLASYDHTKHLLLKTKYFEENPITHFIVSMIAGLFCATTTSPVDNIKSRYMNQEFLPNGKGKVYTSTMDCFAKTIKAEGSFFLFLFLFLFFSTKTIKSKSGFFGVYKGFFPNWMRIGPHTIVTFLILEQLRRLAGLKPI